VQYNREHTGHCFDLYVLCTRDGKKQNSELNGANSVTDVQCCKGMENKTKQNIILEHRLNSFINTIYPK